MDFVYSVPAERQGALKKVLDEEPYAKDSFASVGYVLKESSAVGLKGGRYVVYFKCDETDKIVKFKERLARVEGGVEELTGEEKQIAINSISSQEDGAASGFGSIFG